MKLLIGLGNPGNKYQNNRHNVGFMFVDYLKKVEERGWKMDKYIESEICEIEINNEKVILVKPQTFMNASGVSVLKLTKTYDLEPSNLYVIHDDLDIRLGEYKIQFGKGPKLHNGIESIEKSLRTKDFWRIRIGVDNRDLENRVSGENYVLENFTPEEATLIEAIFPRILNELRKQLFQ